MSLSPALQKNILPLILFLGGLGLAFHKPISNVMSSAKLEMKIQHQPIIMPAVYKVYADENAMDGKYGLFKMLVTNNSSTTARNVEVSFQIPNFVEWKTVTKFSEIRPHQSVVVNCYPQFPDKIIEKTTSSKEQVNIKVTGSNISTTEQNFPIDIKGRNEFMYTCIPADEIRTNAELFDNMDLLSCYVTPEDPIIKYYTQKIQEKVLKGEAASVQNKETEGVRFLTGIYYATLISHMVYSGTSGVPAKIDDVSSMIQSIRLPREVVTGKTGLCIELTLLYASIMINAGMDPIIYLIPGHAYPGFRMNGNYYALESTGIGGEGMGGRMTTQQALEAGMKNLQEFMQHASAGDDRYRIVDVRESIKKGAVAMELKDDSYLRQKVDDIAKAFDPNVQVQTNPQQINYDNPGDKKPDEGNATPKGYNLYEGVVTFSYPGSWKLLPRNPQMSPYVKHIFANASNNADVEVYAFNGINNLQQAYSTLQQSIAQLGGNVQYQVAGQTTSGFQILNGQTFFSNGTVNWMGAFKQGPNGVVGIACGANAATGTKYQSVITNIINSIR